MGNTRFPKDSLVVVATGAGAKMFRNTDKTGDVSLKSEGELEPKDLALEGPSGSYVPESSQQETDEATFSKQLAHHLYNRAHDGDYDHLVFVADPDTLGEVRPVLHQEVKDKIILELDKTLTNSPIDQIEKSLRAA
ncbi:MAG: host attachment family protein [Parasphingorhabdus sp.]|uniref:host attachment family protein n=1 Tax=Parasphingorhabdus sp. TaxID=2709688 RepID=UPI003002D1AF